MTIPACFTFLYIAQFFYSLGIEYRGQIIIIMRMYSALKSEDAETLVASG